MGHLCRKKDERLTILVVPGCKLFPVRSGMIVCHWAIAACQRRRNMFVVNKL